MPIIDFYFPEKSLNPDQKRSLGRALSDSLKQCAHAVSNPRADAINWLYMHEQPDGSIFVAGQEEARPHYRVEVIMLEGMMDEQIRAAIADDMTKAILRVEGTPFNLLNASRVWVIFHDVPEGQWASSGRLQTLGALMRYLSEGKEH
jgi:phenylpyruvate tautomerase PptA (4-oxalocrotonate tautomerase family)